jgi:hypothetical protein
MISRLSPGVFAVSEPNKIVVRRPKRLIVGTCCLASAYRALFHSLSVLTAENKTQGVQMAENIDTIENIETTKKTETFRDLLSRNEILFKTVAATALSIMAVIVSVAQFVTARQQFRLSELQAHIAEANALPVFEIALRQQLNNATGTYDENYLEVVNGGGPVHDFNAEPMYILRIRATMEYDHPNKLGKFGSTDFEVPVNDYFIWQVLSAVSKGLLIRCSGYQNNAQYNAILKRALEITKQPPWAILLLDQLVYVGLTYHDLLDRLHEDMYEVPLVGSGSRLSDKDGRVIRDKWRAGPRVNLNDITAEQLLSEAADRIQKQ